MSRFGKSVILAAVAALMLGLLAGCSTTTYTLRSIISSPKSVSLDVGGTQQLTITAGYNQGPAVVVTAQCSFKSTNASIVTVSASGLVVGVAAGSTTVTASYTESRVTKTVTIPVTVK